MTDIYSYTGAKQTVAISPGTYTLECWGAEGGSANGNAGTSGSGAGGKGAYATVTVTLPACTLVYAVGGMPTALPAHTSDGTCASGGGMSAIAIQGANTPTDDTPLLVAGGGGGGTEVVRGGNVGGNGQGFGGPQGNSGGGWSTTGTTSAGKSWAQGLAAVNGATYGGMTAVGAFGGGGGGQDDSGGGGGAGYYGGNYAKPSTGGTSYATSLYSATGATAATGSRYGNGQVAITRVISNYNSSGSYITTPIDLSTKPNKIRINWSETKPEGTSVTVQTGVTTGSETEPITWVEQTQGELISNIPSGSLEGKYLWIKTILTTTDITATPLFSSLSLEEESYNAKRLIVTLTNKLRCPQGEVSVVYNPGNGNLTGEQGSSILEFTQAFTPTNITPLFNPNTLERVEVASVAVTANLVGVNYKEGYTTENVQVSSVSVTATLTDVSQLP